MNSVAVCDNDVLTAYGHGIDLLWEAVKKRISGISKIDRFDTFFSECQWGGMVKDISCKVEEKSLLIHFIEKLNLPALPEDTPFILGTAKGEADVFEYCFEKRLRVQDKIGPLQTLKTIQTLLGLKSKGLAVLTGGASGSSALAYGCDLVSRGEHDKVLVIAADIITPFLFSEFSTCDTFSSRPCKPFDKHRAGMTVGEGAATVLLMKKEKALQEGRTIHGIIHGWGRATNVSSGQGVSMDGQGLRLAIESSLESAGLHPSSIRGVCANANGDIYGDLIEMRTYKSIFKTKNIPVFSIKGGTGNIYGVSGVVDLLFSIRALKEKSLPATLNLTEIDNEARGWVLESEKPIERGEMLLSVNSGFEGINTAYVLSSE